MGGRKGWLVLGLLLLVQIAFALRLSPGGPFTYDSGTYHMMVRAFLQGRGFAIWNGYDELPSPELVVAQLRTPRGQLVSQYPDGYTLLGAPFYAAFGFRGLMLLNALCFVALLALTFRIGRRWLGERGATLACLVYAVGTFAWEYSQSSYPHLATSLFIVLALDRVTAVLAAPEGATTRAWALRQTFLAGLSCGIAVTLRLDSVFAIPGVVLPFLLRRPPSMGLTLAAVGGLGPPFLFLAVANRVKFGTWSPFSYGAPGVGYVGGLYPYAPLAAVGGLALALFLAWRSGARAMRWSLALVALGFLAVLHAEALRFASTLGRGLWQIVVDLRIRDLGVMEAELTRSPRGAMIYLGEVKKALLQSCPSLILPLVALATGRLASRQRDVALALALPPIAYITFFSYLAWHGSLALNMRYLSPILPFTSLFVAAVWEDLPDHRDRLLRVALPILLVALFLLFRYGPHTIREQERWFLDAPLLLALLLALAFVRGPGRWPRGLLHLLIVLAVAWGGAVAFARDYPMAARQRSKHAQVASAVAPFLHDDVIVFTDFPDTCWNLLEHLDRLRIAQPNKDGGESLPRLAAYHLSRGHAAYLLMMSSQIDELRARRRLDDFQLFPRTTVTVRDYPQLVLIELRPRADHGQPPRP